ncbi:hypothetical protein [Neobacillus niacini]|uniref:hypothetical protein n=1 Tax=Neobacillus niacini TaxID=86668 RepID=UPI0021CB30D8|nr:hypothetical protein [Neobacillus niacini]MCM3767033.1 hypothetical protein [Neobacillus niacini]
MPFYQVKDKYVFLYLSNYNKLNDIALKDKEPSWTFSSKIKGRKENIEAKKLREKTINHIYKNSPYDQFYKEWIYFDLQNHKDILEDLPYLLYDYGCINKLFSYREIHDDTMQTFFPDLYYDKDCQYELALFSKGGLFKKQEKIFSTIIDIREIVSIKGELNDFTIEVRDKTLHFGMTITIS